MQMNGLNVMFKEVAEAMGRAGGNKRAQNLTPKQRSESARNAAKARWAKAKGTLPAKE